MLGSDNKEWYFYYWKIEDFSLCAIEDNHGLRSPAFRTPVSGSNTLLELELLTRNGEERELVVRVQKSSGEGIASQFQCELSFLAANGMVLQNFQVKNIGRSILNPSIYHEFSYPQSEIFGSKKHQFLPHNTLVLRFRIPLCGIPSSHCYTRSVLHSMDFSWKIPHFTCAQPFLTKLFQMASQKFFISLFKGIPYAENRTVDIQVSQSQGNKLSFLSYNFSILDEKGEELHKFHFNDFELSDAGHCNRIPNFFESKFLRNNTLSLQWVFNVGVGEITHEDFQPLSDPLLAIQVGNNPYQTHFKSTWKDDFRRMYKDQLFCDVILKTGNASFSAHKIVLCNRSSVFRDMFVGDLPNNQLNIVDIPDIEPAILEQMLLHVYTNCLEDIHSDDVAKLYHAADKYALQNLKLHCISIMFGELCLSNVCNILDLAFSHHDDELLICVRDYIWKNDKVFFTKEWKDLEMNKPWLTIKLFRMLHFRNK